MAENDETKGGKPEGDAENLEGFEAWYQQLEADQRQMLDEHIRGLKSALEAEREARKNLAKQLGELRGQLDDSSEAAKRIDAIQAEARTAQARAAFYEQAAAAGVVDLRLAWLAASEGGMIDEDGSVDFETLKSRHGALFGGETPPTSGYAGAGAGAKPPAAESMDDLIRKRAK